ncbi:MAG: hypothetical protein HWE22_10005 [Flavobacteriales bacterium]|nr:hypothetical protein [Flavobacteriales bacterium]
MKRRNIIFILSCLLWCVQSCDVNSETGENEEQTEIETTNKENMSEIIEDKEIQNLLDGVNDAVNAGGDPNHPIEGLVSKGESNAMFSEFKKRLEEKGYHIEWDQDKYKLVKAE